MKDLRCKFFMAAMLIILLVFSTVSEAFCANVMTTDSYSFTIIPDTEAPYTTGYVPAKDATGVSSDSNVVVHVKDDGAGVDISSIVMTVNGVSVSPVITGSPADYLLTYDPVADFTLGQEIFVTIKACDLAP
ncbi:MAG: hypothetical protein L6416_02215 [Candidatus Omnitrophica bacterium]|nr:hypothetical protein [Candidatus Omnitrophota bacterium]